MSRPGRSNRQLQDAVLTLVSRYPKQALVLAVLVGAVLLGYYLWTHWPKRESPPPMAGSGEASTALLCAWNVENFYDDHDDANIHDEIEDWFGNDSTAFRTKVDHLAEALLQMNGGAGPDIACLCEVENEHCMTALMDALNAKLEAAGLSERKYVHVLFKGDNTGRHFAPGILTRLDVAGDRTRKLGTRANGRILEGHLSRNGYELVVIAAHWTSRVSDGADDGHRRMSYAKDCYGRVRAVLTENPDADVVVCGDFNDEFADESIQKGLHASDNVESVRSGSSEPQLLDLFGRWDRNRDPPGTIRHQRKWSVFDHICVTRGLLDEVGWTCDTQTATIFAPDLLRRKRGRDFEPFKFGNRSQQGPRGYSDHLPVTVQFHIAGARTP